MSVADITAPDDSDVVHEVKMPLERKRLPANPSLVLTTPVLAGPVNLRRFAVMVHIWIVLEPWTKINGEVRVEEVSAVDGSSSMLKN